MTEHDELFYENYELKKINDGLVENIKFYKRFGRKANDDNVKLQEEIALLRKENKQLKIDIDVLNQREKELQDMNRLLSSHQLSTIYTTYPPITVTCDYTKMSEYFRKIARNHG